MEEPLSIRWHSAISEIPEDKWDSLAHQQPSPLLEYQWLHSLEASGSISPQFGWQPLHLTLWRQDELVSGAPFYVKSHSAGEFVFDHWLAKLALEFGISYYPKLVGMSPATPSSCYQMLIAKTIKQETAHAVMLEAIDTLCKEHQLSGCQLNFVDEQWAAEKLDQHFHKLQHQAYLWNNQGFDDFTDYLTLFKSNQRRNIKRERNSMGKQGITIRSLTGNEIPCEIGDLMYRYYLKTNARYGQWAARFLNHDFFERIFNCFRHRILLLAAYNNSNAAPVALSMLLVKNRHLVGRYWGCEESFKDLHFNMCYYEPIQWAIENQIQTFDPGMGSPHKIMRGFEAVSSTSLHRFYNPQLDSIFRQCTAELNTMAKSDIRSLNASLPFAKEQTLPPLT